MVIVCVCVRLSYCTVALAMAVGLLVVNWQDKLRLVDGTLYVEGTARPHSHVQIYLVRNPTPIKLSCIDINTPGVNY